ncbi:MULTISPECIES: hypothetical protein [Arthrobacter]|uniref:Uncharacterized protein n=1 Tax=Arthrobacter terricola TaxID=2547396 RepID=A0A4V2ZS50_9MICC|nr:MULTISPECIES: hypothetical protein [Arthrobacter]MBT8163010.1 hypothetical protein [Arthrobacter sp. GN70]TDF91784.1 hypothetical protein E1809_19900 [Arthrobacter terricola]
MSPAAKAITRDYRIALTAAARDLAPAGSFTLLLSDSLARHEPAITQGTDGQWRLVSDIDLVLIRDGGADDALDTLPDIMRSLRPTIVTTMFTVEAAHSGHLRSLFGADTVLAARSPVLTGTGTPRVASAPIRRRELYENFIHQLANHAFKDGTLEESSWLGPHATERYRHLKLALEAFRLTYPTPDRCRPVSYHRAAHYSQAVDRSATRRLLERQFFTDQSGSGIDVEHCAIKALDLFFRRSRTPYRTPGEAAARGLTQLVRNIRGPFDLYQFSLPLVYLRASLPEHTRQTAAKALHSAWMQYADETGRSVPDQLLRQTRQTLDEQGWNSPSVRDLYRAMRSTHSDLLGAHNFGRLQGTSYQNI